MDQPNLELHVVQTLRLNSHHESKAFLIHRNYHFSLRRPPEKLCKDAGNKFQVGLSSDVWSLGVLLLQLACCNLWMPYGPGVDLSNVAAQVGCGGGWWCSECCNSVTILFGACRMRQFII